MTTNLDLNRKTLGHIVALLLSMAVLAERAAARPLVVRLVVFWILRRAELGARTLFGAFDANAPATSPRSGGGVEPNDLLRLAASFRAMATLLSLPGWTFAAPNADESPVAGRHAPSPRDLARRFSLVPINDTS